MKSANTCRWISKNILGVKPQGVVVDGKLIGLSESLKHDNPVAWYLIEARNFTYKIRWFVYPVYALLYWLCK